MPQKGLFIIAAICFVLAAFDVKVTTVDLTNVGLALVAIGLAI